MLKQILVENFRNLEDLVWSPQAGSHLVLGDNGAGKTSLLEAIYAVATTKSFRSPQIADCVRRPSEGGKGDQTAHRGFRLQAEVVSEARRIRLELGWAQGSGWRRFNGGQTKLAEYLQGLPVVAWTAADGDLFLGLPEVGRRFLDRGVVATKPGKLSVLAQYRKILRQKRELLWRQQAGIESWNQVLAQVAAELIALRERYVQDLREAFGEALRASGMSYPPVDLLYEPSPTQGRDGLAAIEEALGRVKAEEQAQGRPLLGPHRDRLRVRWGGRDLRRVASAGERKGIGLLLLAAQGTVLRRAARGPVYLVDDADSELDRRAVEALWQVLKAADQIVLSSNRPEVWEKFDLAHRWKVDRGVVREDS